MSETEAIVSHLMKFCPGRRIEAFEWTIGPINRTLPGFQVLRLGPTEAAPDWIYVSLGAWSATPDSEHGTGFLILSPVESVDHVETLAMVANFYADPRYDVFPGKILNIGRPWLEGSRADHLLVSPPYTFEASFQVCNMNARHVRFLWLVPITASEAEFARQEGVEALKERLEQSALDMEDPCRAPVA